MAHFAELDENKIVLRVLVTDNNATNEGYDWLVENLGGVWVQTSYNNNFRKKFALIGDTYNSDLDAFISPQPYPSWLLDPETATWQPPIPQPEGMYVWNEEILNWEALTPEEI